MNLIDAVSHATRSAGPLLPAARTPQSRRPRVVLGPDAQPVGLCARCSSVAPTFVARRREGQPAVSTRRRRHGLALVPQPCADITLPRPAEANDDE
jgi:hypothetical protein